MKKLLLVIAAVTMLLPSCQKINEAIDGLDSRLDKLEQEAIPSIDEQISAINTTLGNLDAMDKELKGYIDNLTTTASSLQEQINATNAKIEEVKTALQSEISTAKSEVLAQLATAKTELENELAQINSTIETLQAKDTELDNKIAELRSYVDNELGKTTDWVNATFATLEQYNALVSEVATIKEQIKAINQSITELETRLTTKINEDIANAVSTLNADIQQKVSEITTTYTSSISTAKEEITTAYTTAIQNAINALDVSLKAWVGEQLANYYTIAEVEAKITALQTAITDGDADLQQELNTLKEQLTTTANEINEAYKKAIEEAITTNNGEINTKIANEIASINQRITNEVATINAKIAEIESRLDNIEAKIAELLARIQSVSYIPTYSDGKATVKYSGNTSRVTLDFDVSPKDAVVELAKVWRSAVSVKAVYTQTRAVEFIDMPITKFEADTTNGVITVTASAENLASNFFAGPQSASACLAISDGNTSITSEYIPMVAKEDFTREVWYTNGSTTEATTPYKTNVFGANILSNTYDAEKECWVIKFDGEVTSIGSYAFAWCESLTSITIPESVTSTGYQAFEDCRSLKSVYYKGDLSDWCNIDFDNSDSNPLCYGAKLYINNTEVTEVTIPSDISEIKDCTFSDCSSLTSVTIGSGVTSIGSCAFSNCSSLTSVTIGNGVTSIGKSAFYSCDSLTSVTIPDSVTSIGDSVFAWCESLTSITIPDSVTSIGSYAFVRCESLTSITIPESVTSIGKNTFSNCSGLTSVTIGNGVTSIGDGAFNECSSLTSVTIPDSVTTIGNEAFYFCRSLTSITIPDSVTSIGDDAFSYCSSLTSVTIPDSVTSIGDDAFWGCNSLTSVYCMATTPPTGGDDMFLGNASGRKIYVPTESVNAYKSASYWSDYKDYIVGYDFATDETLQPADNEIWYTTSDGNVVTPYATNVFNANIVSNTYDAEKECLVIKFDGDVTSIGNRAFFDCSSLTSVTIPDSVTSIGSYAFYYCTPLTSVTIPDSVTSIGCEAFYFCSSLTSITIPDSVTSIEGWAFEHSISLKEVYCKSTTPPTGGSEMFAYNASGRKIYVPRNSVEAYKSAEYWSEYASAIVGYDFE